MAEKDSDEPRLELPSFGLGRKRRKQEPAADEPVAETEPVAAVEPATATAPLATATETQTEPAAPTGGERKQEKAPRQVGLPAISGRAASLVTGLLVGVLTVGATWGSLRLCEVLQGTPSCGDPGFVLLVAILVAMVVIGAMLLRAWGIPDPGSTSFLAVGLLAVVALLFLVDLLFEWWMIIVIPLVAVLTFALSHWFTTSLVGPAKH